MSTATKRLGIPTNFGFGSCFRPQIFGGKENGNPHNLIKTANVKDFESSAVTAGKSQIQEGTLNQSFTDLTISEKNQKKAGGKTSTTKFLYEPAMFPNRLVKQVTGGKDWHDLSPNTKQKVNQELKSK